MDTNGSHILVASNVCVGNDMHMIEKRSDGDRMTHNQKVSQSIEESFDDQYGLILWDQCVAI
jgi:hypothetical protein